MVKPEPSVAISHLIPVPLPLVDVCSSLVWLWLVCHPVWLPGLVRSSTVRTPPEVAFEPIIFILSLWAKSPNLLFVSLTTAPLNDIPVLEALADVFSNDSETNVSENAVYSTLRPLDMSSLGYISCLPKYSDGNF